MQTTIKVSVYKNNKIVGNSETIISQKKLRWVGEADFIKEKFSIIIDKLYDNGFLVTKNTGNTVVMQNTNKIIHLYLVKA